MTDIVITDKADDHLEGLDPTNREQVLKKLAEAQDWTEHHLRRLSGWPYYKLRAGSYRAIITWDRENNVLIVEAVGHRRYVYDRYLPP